MKHFLLITLFSLITTFAFAKEPNVLVSIAPQKFLVEKITNKRAAIQVLVPQSFSSHTYEPTIKEMIRATKADIWFCIGEPFEKKIQPALSQSMQIVEITEGVDLIESSCGPGKCCHGTHDPHIWLSALLLKQQAKVIVDQLIQLAPENRSFYLANYEKLTEELDALHHEIQTMVAGKKNGTILVSHPAFAYFCRDYTMQQLSIEMEGKEPSPRYTTQLIDQARQADIRCIFVQKQFPLKGVQAIQRALGATLVEIDPYNENVIANLKTIASAIEAS